MKRVPHRARADWIEHLQAVGIAEPIYTADRGTEEREWNEDAVYTFTPNEIQTLRDASVRMRDMVLKAVDTAIANPAILERMAIPTPTQELMQWSWQAGQRNLIGRYDWSFDGTSAPKLIEINGETCYGMLAASRAQAQFRSDQFPEAGQWNDLEPDIIGAFARLRDLRRKEIAFSCDAEDPARTYETRFVKHCAERAKRKTRFVPQGEIAFDHDRRLFVDGDDQPIDALFLFQMWELTIDSELAEHFFAPERVATVMLEPVWRLLVSNKAFLAWLWELFEGDELLLPTFVDHDPIADRLGESYAQKPIYGFEGANVKLIRDGEILAENREPDADSSDGFVYQQLALLPQFDGHHPLCCTWEVADRISALSIREGGLITDYFSPIVPHIIEDA